MYEDRGTLCPLRGGRPCMGNDCAMAVYSATWNGWRCGLASENDMEACNIIGYDHVDEDAREMVRRMMEDDLMTDAQKIAALKALEKENESNE